MVYIISNAGINEMTIPRFKIGDYVYYPKANVHGYSYFYVINISLKMHDKGKYEYELSTHRRENYHKCIKRSEGAISIYVSDRELRAYNHGLKRAVMRVFKH